MTRKVVVEAVVHDADADTVFARIGDFERYPELTDAVQEVRIINRHDQVVESEWTVRFRDGVLRWGERELVNQAERSITFVQTWGDFASFAGSWDVEPLPDTVLLRFAAEFDL